MLFSGVKALNESFLISGVVSGTPLNISRGALYEVDLHGEMTRYKVIGDSTTEHIGLFENALIGNKAGGICFAGYVYDSLPSLLFGLSDTALNNIQIHKYYSPQTGAFQAFSLLEYDNVGYFVTGVRTDSFPSNANVVLMKIDFSGNRVWEKVYNQKILDYGKSLIQLKNGNLLIGAFQCDINLTIEHANTWLIEVDTGGNLVRQWFDPNDSTYVAFGLKQTADGGYIYAARKKTKQNVNTISKVATIVKLDSAFNKEWIFTGGRSSRYTSLSDVEILPNGDYVACGYRPYDLLDSNSVAGWVVKLNSVGDVLWQRMYMGIDEPNSFNYLTDIDILPDGSFIVVGESEKSSAVPPQVGWFLKLDSNGCELESCYVNINEKAADNSIQFLKVHPNPVQEKLTIQFPPLASNTPLLIEVQTITGQVMFQGAVEGNLGKVEIDIHDLSEGLYVVTLAKHGVLSAQAKFIKL